MIRRLFRRLFARESDTALTRRQWYMAGRKDERRHAKVRTNFPLSP